MPEFERVDGAVQWEGRVIRAGLERYRYPDGEEVSRDKVWHPGAVAILAVDDTRIWLCRQPREAANLSASLEVPAGKRDVSEEPPLATAKRELVEEVGKVAAVWRELLQFCTSPGFSDERVWLFLATGLTDTQEPAEAEEDERIEIVPWSLDDLDGALAECEDSKTLIALLWLAQAGARGELHAG